MALLIGFVLVSALGIAHPYGLLAVRAMKPSSNEKPKAAIMVTFLGLLALHPRYPGVRCSLTECC